MKKIRVKSVKWLSAGGFIACQIRNNLDECRCADAHYAHLVVKIVCDLKEIADAGNVLLQEKFY
ncbi:hypothetical protein TUM17577_22850 [Enterobacter asburiae]|nr:hypothetical protein TUM17577_22850 [Enterobacter asburiae]